MTGTLDRPSARPAAPRGAPNAPGASPDGGRPGHTARVGAARRDRERPYRRALRIGLAVSLVVHFLLVFVLSRELEIEALPYVPVDRPVVPEGIELVDPVIVPEELPQRTPPAEEEPEPQPAEEAPAPRGTPVPAPEEAEEGELLTNAEKLQVREGDPRLWEDFAELVMLDRRVLYTERGEAALRARLRVILDSIALTEEQRRKAREWIIGEGDQSWGITPEGIVLGGTKIPIPLGSLFGLEGEEGREARREARDLDAIRRQDARGDAERIREERAREMRERSREEARRRAEKDSTEQETEDGTGGG